MAKNMAMAVMPPPHRVHFSFDKGKLPNGFDKLTMGKEITLTVKGKVASLSQDDYACGFSLENFTVKLPENPDLRRLG